MAMSSYYNNPSAAFLSTMAYFLLFLFIFILPTCDSLSFELPRFDSSTNVILFEGDAVPMVGAIEFNNIEYVTIGFSAATGQYLGRHSLQSWEFDSSLNIKVTKGKDEGRTRLVVGLVVSFVVLIGGVGITLVIWWKSKMRRAMYIEGHGITGDFERGTGPKRFIYRELVSATNNFSNDRKLGEGGFGCVYTGFLSYLDLAIAIKKISRGSRQWQKEYITEVKTISQLRYRNLVQLLGWCHVKGEFLLVYEFMPNGSLDAHLFSKTKLLTWAAYGSDHELGPQTTGLAGTLGYLAPEYISTGKASKESDVFSFGVVALEIASGRKSVYPMGENSEMGLSGMGLGSLWKRKASIYCR
ncbi:L-type lectin-domain containing receptor kinase IX.1 [Thalictrum thalictroides]|uniref:L-type lectin-domain containing receptor kinase IX.1 n=1 Tax=Thalictrum thalictroides TaxID=46969 RepID=A0A7J6W435_THATH|nr:L-type lectin-domain containing receptor kinase IX.1 [Thalictrum thalictroides]